jgi:hypothetical protein
MSNELELERLERHLDDLHELRMNGPDERGVFDRQRLLRTIRDVAARIERLQDAIEAEGEQDENQL